MRRKLKRGRRSVFGKRGMPPALKTVLWIVVCVAVVAVGYFGAMLVSDGGLPTKPHTPSSNIENPAGNPNTPDGGGNTDDEPTTPDTPKPPVNTPDVTEDIRAFYLPSSALSVDTLRSSGILTAARGAGFNAVVFDLKDADGVLYYQFANAHAKKVGYADNALSSANLDALFDLIQENGLSPIPRLYAFCDNAAASVITDARIALESNHSWAWYDGDPNDGGKKWLNPYSEAAHAYIGALATELKDKGAAAVMLDGVQFPRQLSSAYLGEDAATVTKDAALATFVAKTRTLLGTNCPLMLACTAESALGTDTKVYGGNPLTFGATIASPTLTSKVKESVEKMILRTQVLEEKPTLAPLLMADSLTTGQVNDAISACVKGGVKSFILYHSEGSYDFSSYDLP
ncbi:MAG: hypothetical protein IKL13_03875 [Clostridia bacterium]|nr:hypothetical protein [Clostridia bacterium]